MDRPSLEQDDLKAQFNAIVSPYGILFPGGQNQEEHSGQDSSPLPVAPYEPTNVLCKELAFTAAQKSVVTSTEAITESCLENDNLIDAQPAPWSDALPSDRPVSDNHYLEEKEDQDRTLATHHTFHSSASDQAMGDIEAGNVDGPADGPPYRNSVIGKYPEGTKHGSKLAKGWKKFRQSLRHQDTIITSITKTTSTGALAIKNIYGSHSSVSEERHRSVSLAAFSELGGRKTVSDMDPPLGAGSASGTLESKKGLQSGLGARFRSGSFKGFLLKGSSVASSLSELEIGDVSSIDMSVGRDSGDSSLQGGAVVVDVESIMSLGRMRQYSRDDLLKQQRLQHLNPRKSPLAQSAELEPEYASATDNLGCATYNTSFDSDGQPPLVGPDSTPKDVQLHGAAKEPSTHLQEEDLERGATDSPPAYDERGEDGLLDTQSEMQLASIAQGPAASPEPISSQRWRLSMDGEPSVFGTICERKRSEVCSNGHYLQHLMSDFNEVEDISLETSSPEESDRQDRVFNVPLHQSVQVASAMFENGSKIPLVLYYVAHELRVRGDMSAAIDELFTDICDEQGEAFEALIKVLDNRPFGQDLDLIMAPLAQESALHGYSSQGSPGSMEMDGLIQSLGMETGSSHWDGQDIAFGGTGHQSATFKKRAFGVTSRDLFRIILRFLSDLSEPLIPDGVFTTFSAVAHLQTLDSIKIQASSLLVQLLAPEQRQLLQFLLEFLDDYMLRPLRIEIQNLECQSDLESTLDPIESEQRRDLGDKLVAKYDESIERLSRIFGTVCTHVTHPTATSVAGTSRATNQSQNSLYRHYKKEFEQKAIQEQTATATRHAQAVFRALLTYRVSIFGPSSFLSLEAVAKENGFQDQQKDVDQDIDKGVGQGYDQDQAFEGNLDADYEYQSDSALYDPPTRCQSRKRRSKPSPGSCINQRFFKPWGSEQPPEQRASDNGEGEMPLAIRTTRSNDCDQDCIQKETSSDIICDSAVEVTSNVDLVALTAMREHMARSSRSNRHLPRPSVATLHSIMAETDSVSGSKTTSRKSSSQAERSNQPNAEHGYLGSTDTSTGEGTEWRDDTNDSTEVDVGRGYDNDEFGVDYRKPGYELGSKDRLQEAIDRRHGEREIKMVEKEILKSEITTKFLTANITGLYPSSTSVPIPLTILPSVRPLLVRQEGGSGAEVTQSNGIVSSLSTSSSRNRELMLRPQEKIQTPLDHCASDDCSCSYCMTLIKPSTVPVLSRAEYELAELQSQCDSKDQHIAELLKTVQGLQGQVNVLNAKLIFLHDHHTTRPMRRRTLARSSNPVSSSTAANGRAGYSNGSYHQHQHQQPPSCLNDDDSADARDLDAISTGDIGPADMQGLPAGASFPDGILPCNNNTRVGGVGTLENDPFLPDCASEMPALEEDEAMSIFDLNNNNARSQHIPRHTAVLGDGHRASVMRHSIKGQGDYHPYQSDLERVLRDMDEAEEESEREGEDVLDEYYYMDAYKTMDQQLYRRPILPVPAAPLPMSTEVYTKHHRMSLPIQTLMSKRITLGNSFRWRGRATAI